MNYVAKNRACRYTCVALVFHALKNYNQSHISSFNYIAIAVIHSLQQ